MSQTSTHARTTACRNGQSHAEALRTGSQEALWKAVCTSLLQGLSLQKAREELELPALALWVKTESAQSHLSQQDPQQQRPAMGTPLLLCFLRLGDPNQNW